MFAGVQPSHPHLGFHFHIRDHFSRILFLLEGPHGAQISSFRLPRCLVEQKVVSSGGFKRFGVAIERMNAIKSVEVPTSAEVSFPFPGVSNISGAADVAFLCPLMQLYALFSQPL